MAVLPPKQGRVIYYHPLPFRMEFVFDVVKLKPQISI